MCTGIALPVEDFPVSVVKRHRLLERVYDRAGLPEVQFHWWHQPTLLPVRLHRRLEIIPWGCHAHRSPLPYGGWVPLEHVESGLLAGARPEAVVIPAVVTSSCHFTLQDDDIQNHPFFSDTGLTRPSNTVPARPTASSTPAPA